MYLMKPEIDKEKCDGWRGCVSVCALKTAS